MTPQELLLSTGPLALIVATAAEVSLLSVGAARRRVSMVTALSLHMLAVPIFAALVIVGGIWLAGPQTPQDLPDAVIHELPAAAVTLAFLSVCLFLGGILIILVAGAMRALVRRPLASEPPRPKEAPAIRTPPTIRMP